jgi:glutamate synthase (NADPH) small chain
MTEKMLKFVDLARVMPPKRPAKTRTHDFDEIYTAYPSEQAAAQASRCSQCGVPFCQAHCPLANNIPDWLKLAAEGRLEEAYELSSATNPMPEVCGRICPQDRLCEGACVIEQAGHGTVTIGAVEKYITDTAFARGWVKPLTPTRERKQSVGIVGGGPAGLACAESLRRLGYAVTVYERSDRAGGLLTYGIPNFKLDKAIVMRRIDRLAEGGVDFKLNFEVGRDASLDELRDRHDAMFLAVGVAKANDLEAPGSGLTGIVPALDFLIAANRAGFGDKLTPAKAASLSAKNKDVVVIGGGDTAMDALRTAIRQGAKSVTCLYRRDRDNMPGSTREVTNAIEEGVKFNWLTKPKAFLGDGMVNAIVVQRMRLGLPDAAGRKIPEEIKDSEYTLPASLAIKALGFAPEDLPAKFASPNLAVGPSGAVRVNGEMMTGLDGVFAGGDIVRGASLAVWAIKDGLKAAAAIHAYIQAKQPQAAE